MHFPIRSPATPFSRSQLGSSRSGMEGRLIYQKNLFLWPRVEGVWHDCLIKPADTLLMDVNGIICMYPAIMKNQGVWKVMSQ